MPDRTTEFHISVRQMAEFICRSGDLTSGGFQSPERALEGTKAHQKIQKSRGGDYQKEVALSRTVDAGDGLSLVIEGRADGITTVDGRLCVEEIKSTYASGESLGFDYEPTHRAQLLCYAAMICEDEPGVLCRLTYYQLETEEEFSFEQYLTKEELEAFFADVAERCAMWVRWQNAHILARNTSLERLEFPYPEYREGQRTMAAYVYKTIQDGHVLFLQAPTGIGKTISALFPSLKAMGQGLTSKIFYLTAKNAAARAAQEALDRLSTQEPELLSVSITAKDKICPMPERACTPDVCPYAKGHYDRINDAVYEAVTAAADAEAGGSLKREQILAIAEKHHVCPFELELDISTWSDVIIGDYNYAFDPTASLKRFFGENEKTDYTLLVDEAHNLPERAQSMYSAELGRAPFVDLQARFRGRPARVRRRLRRQLREIVTWFDEKEEVLSDRGACVEASPPTVLTAALDGFREELADWLMKEGSADTAGTQLYFDILFWLRMAEAYDDSSVVYSRKEGTDVQIRIYCVHPAEKLAERYDQVRAVILFSATLLPIAYYREMLEVKDEKNPSQAICLPSPFDPSHLAVVSADGVRTDYKSREASIGDVCAVIYRTVHAHEGNYIVFFPSYPYLQRVADFYRDAYPGDTILLQESGMTEENREEWLGHFREDPPWTLAFAVMGGAFSEGIDLTGKRLIGTVIVTVGIPQIGLERDLVRDAMDRLTGSGFDYAYRYPGLNKVFQAAGRVIRTETDRGVIVLLDARYQEPVVRRNLPADWDVKVTDPSRVGEVLEEFWKGQE